MDKAIASNAARVMDLEEHADHSKRLIERMVKEHDEATTNKELIIRDLKEKLQTANMRISALEKEVAARERPTSRSPRRTPSQAR